MLMIDFQQLYRQLLFIDPHLSLLLVEVGSGVVVGHTVGVGEGPGRDLDLAVNWGRGAIRGWGSSRGESKGGADQNNGENELEFTKKIVEKSLI
jgi:hypothetical protein